MSRPSSMLLICLLSWISQVWAGAIDDTVLMADDFPNLKAALTIVLEEHRQISGKRQILGDISVKKRAEQSLDFKVMGGYAIGETDEYSSGQNARAGITYKVDLLDLMGGSQSNPDRVKAKVDLYNTIDGVVAQFMTDLQSLKLLWLDFTAANEIHVLNIKLASIQEKIYKDAKANNNSIGSGDYYTAARTAKQSEAILKKARYQYFMTLSNVTLRYGKVRHKKLRTSVTAYLKVFGKK